MRDYSQILNTNMESEAIHIQRSYEQAVEDKRSLLEVQISLLNAMEKVITVRELRSQDYKMKSQARVLAKDILHHMDILSEILPKVEIPPEEILAAQPRQQKPAKKRECKRMKLASELQSIKDRLEKLR